MIKQAEILYQQAKHLVEQAIMAEAKQVSGVDYKVLFEKAYNLKKEVALLMSAEETEPMPRTWMMSSAASLAYRAGKFEEAEKAIALCRSFGPDDYISGKLDELESLIKKTSNGIPKKGSLKVTGLLSSANDNEKEIKIKDEQSHQVYSMIVPAAMFKDVVKSYWLEMVNAVAKVSPHCVFTLQKISKAA